MLQLTFYTISKGFYARESHPSPLTNRKVPGPSIVSLHPGPSNPLKNTHGNSIGGSRGGLRGLQHPPVWKFYQKRSFFDIIRAEPPFPDQTVDKSSHERL